MQPNRKNNSIEIEIKVLTGNDVAKLFDSAKLNTPVTSDQVYVFGIAWNTSGKRAMVQLELSSGKIPYLKKDGVKIGWIPPRKSEAIFFLEHLGTVLGGQEKMSDLRVTYHINKTWEK